MRVEKLKAAIEVLKSELGQALVACDIFDGSGLSYAGHNSNPAATALFTDITARLLKALKDSGFPALDRYYMLVLKDNQIVVVALVGSLQMGLLVDGNKVNMGLLLNIAVKKAIEVAKAAL